jgi:hypothetical protein
MAEAAQQQAGRETRQLVVRSALEKHFSGICAFARKLMTQISRTEPLPVSSDMTGDPFWRSLKEHLSRSPLWSNFEKWNSLETACRESANALRKRAEREAVQRTGMVFSSSIKQQGFYEGWFGAAIFHAQSVARGWSGLKVAGYRLDRTTYGIRLDRGDFTVALTSEKRIPALKRAFDTMLKDIENWPEYHALKHNTDVFLGTRSVIQDELTTIIMRRVVPGRCKYCPI